MCTFLSVIIPVLNEASGIQAFLSPLQKFRQQGVEFVIVDGGSTDATIELARPFCDVIVESPKGRAKQMNMGAKHARGGLLLFLHADTLLPDNFLFLIEQKWKKNKKLWGRFNVRLSGARVSLRLIEYCMNLRSRWTGIATGDQAIFVSAALFHELKGYPDIPLMEDIALSKALKKISRPVSLPEKVITSSRRWEKFGIWQTVFLMWQLRLSYFFGVNPRRLAARYEQK